MIAVGLKNAIDALGIDGLTVNYDSANPGQLAFVNDSTVDLSVSGQYRNAGSGGLGALSSIDVSTAANAETALVPFGLGETQVAGTDTHARLARAEQDKRDGRSRGAVRLKVDDMKMLNTEQVPVSPESLLQADELTRI